MTSKTHRGNWSWQHTWWVMLRICKGACKGCCAAEYITTMHCNWKNNLNLVSMGGVLAYNIILTASAKGLNVDVLINWPKTFVLSSYKQEEPTSRWPSRPHSCWFISINHNEVKLPDLIITDNDRLVNQVSDLKHGFIAFRLTVSSFLVAASDAVLNQWWQTTQLWYC